MNKRLGISSYITLDGLLDPLNPHGPSDTDTLWFILGGAGDATNNAC